MESDSDIGARSAPKPSPLQVLRKQWREKQTHSPLTPRRLAEPLSAVQSPQADDIFAQRASESSIVASKQAVEDFLADCWQDSEAWAAPQQANKDASERGQGLLPESPSEEDFVAGAAVRRDAYLKLEMWLLAGGSPEPFAPWFRELLMDKDAEAFIAACRAVASHYRRVAQQRALGQAAAAAPCRPWLPGFLERLKADSPEQHKEAAELVASVLAAPRLGETTQRHEFFDDLASLEPLPPGAESLLRCCEAHAALQWEDLEQLRSVVTPFAYLPDIQAPLSPGVEQSGFLASPMRPIEGPEDPLRLLSTASPKSWRKRVEALDAIQGPDADGVHGQLLWPQLVLQAEDDHPAVAAAAFRCLARLAPLLVAPGDHLLDRLAAAVKARSKGRRRDWQEAARSLLGAAARCPRAVGGPAGLGAFLRLALGLKKERAKSVVLELLAERHQPAVAGGFGLPAPLESLLQELGKLRPPELRSEGFTPSPTRKRGVLLSHEFCRQSPRISPVQKATPSTSSPGAFLAFAEALPHPDSVPPLCRFASPVKPWKQVRHWELRTPDTTRGSVASIGPSLPSESRLLSLSQAPSPEILGDTQSTTIGTSPQELPVSPEPLGECEARDEGEEEEEAVEEEDKPENEDQKEQKAEDEGAELETILDRLASESPQVLAKELVPAFSERAPSVVDFLLGSLLSPPPGIGSGKMAELLQRFVEELLSSGDLRSLKDLDLPSLPSVADAASSGRLGTTLPALRRALEPLLRHLAPGAVPESCWTQLRKILAERRLLPAEESVDAAPEEATQVSALEVAELSATFQKIHRITTELSRPVQNADEVLLPLRQAAQVLSRPQAQGPLRNFLRRLRARKAAKENAPPLSKTSSGRLQTSLTDDYACARELAAEEGLVGSFPSSLFPPLRRLLGRGSAVAQRGAAEVVAACAAACGTPLLRGLLSLAAPLLKVASSRGPAQGAARTALAQMSAQGWSAFRATWRALMQAILASSSGGRPGVAGMVDQGSGQLLEVFRALEEVWPRLAETTDKAPARQALGELLAVAAPSCLHSSSQLRSAAARALRGAATALSAEALEEEIGSAAISGAAAAAARAALESSDDAEPVRRVPPAARSSLLVPDCALRAEATPAASQPRRLHFSPAPSESRGEKTTQRLRRSKTFAASQAQSSAIPRAAEGHPGAEDAVQDLEADIEGVARDLETGQTDAADFPGLVGTLRAGLQELTSRSRAGATEKLLRPMLLLLWRLSLAAEAAAEAQDSSANLLKAVCEVAAACRSFPATAFVALGDRTPFQCLLQTLACLQSLSQGSSARVRRACGPALLELPPLLAQAMDAVEADSQFIAWLRVARELLSDPSALETSGRAQKGPEDGQALREWALRFCLRGAQRCADSLTGRTDTSAWEVLSEITALHETLDTRLEGEWLPLLQGVALRLVQTRRTEATEFARLASIAGRPMLPALKQLLELGPQLSGNHI